LPDEEREGAPKSPQEIARPNLIMGEYKMKFEKLTTAEIQNTTLITEYGKTWAQDNFDYLNKPMTILGTNEKVEKGSDKFNTYILHLAPHNLISVNTLCASAEASGCAADCLAFSGRLAMKNGANAMFKRTVLMLLRPEWFESKLLSEIDKAEAKAKRDNIPPLFRLNGTSDLDWSHIFKARPESKAYDYTKVLSRIRKNNLPNYDLTFSASMYSQQSRSAFKKAVERKHRIAVAFNTKESKLDKFTIPSGFKSFDDTDLRHLDDQVIGVLKRKGSNISERLMENRKRESFFVTESNLEEFNIIARSA
jgi:hypothetical protein